MRRMRAAATAGAITYPPMPSTTSGRKRSTIRSAARRAVGMRYGRARFFQGASRSSPRTRTVSSSNPAAGDSENQESEHHQGRADQAGLLADDGEDEVGVRLRQPPVLLDRVPDADAEEPAGRQSIERLGRLKTCAERVRPRIPERGEA